MVRTGFTLVAIAIGLGAFGVAAFVDDRVCFDGAAVRFEVTLVFFGDAIVLRVNTSNHHLKPIVSVEHLVFPDALIRDKSE